MQIGAVIGLPATKDGKKYTYADYLTWTDGRYELIDGVVYNMTPGPATPHMHLTRTLTMHIGPYFKGHKCTLCVAPYDVLFYEPGTAIDEIENVLQPDLFVVCSPDKLHNNGCHGVPDFIIEITSPSTAIRDQSVKANLYEKHGVKEYWIVHPTDKLLHIRLLGDDGKFEPVQILAAEGKIPVNIFSGLEIDFDQVFDFS